MRLAYLEVSEKPEQTISHEDFEYRLTSFTTKIDSIAEQKLVMLSRLGKPPICVKYGDKYYIYIKVWDKHEDGDVSTGVQVPSCELPEPVSGGSTEDGINVGASEK